MDIEIKSGVVLDTRNTYSDNHKHQNEVSIKECKHLKVDLLTIPASIFNRKHNQLNCNAEHANK